MVESLQWFNLWKHLLDQRLGGSSDPLIWPYMLYNCCTTFILYNIYGDINIYTYINIHTCICTHTYIYIYIYIYCIMYNPLYPIVSQYVPSYDIT